MRDDEMGVRVGARYDSATPLAAHNGDVGVVRGFCELPGGRGMTPDAAVRSAALDGDVDAVWRLCASRGVNPGADDNYAIRLAAASGHVDVVRVRGLIAA